MKKTAIIGAGINGLYLAWQLAQKNHPVFVFEKKAEIGKQACSGLFSEKILEFIPESKQLIENKIDFVLIHFPGKTLKINFKTNFLVMNHFKLDQLVGQLAEQAGAKIYLKKSINNLTELTEFDRIIGCDGADSLVSQSLNLAKQKFLLAVQGFVDQENRSNYVETWPVKNGFIWKIPRGKQIEWGIMTKPEQAKLVFNNFLKKRNIILKETKAALVPEKFNFLYLKNPKITVCGDAAGLVKPWSGGGVIWGLIAAEQLLKNFPDFLKYHKALKKFFLLKIIFSKIAVKLVYFFGFNFAWLLPKKFKINNDFLI
jgi:digeranylgeranylglycerophospholipid reductase